MSRDNSKRASSVIKLNSCAASASPAGGAPQLRDEGSGSPVARQPAITSRVHLAASAATAPPTPGTAGVSLRFSAFRCETHFRGCCLRTDLLRRAKSDGCAG